MAYFTDKIAIVTGAASGIGLALAEELVRGGAKVEVADIDADGAAQAAQKLGPNARSRTVDVTRAEDVERLVDEVVARHGRLDLMINNAGIGLLGEVRDLDLEHWRRTVDINQWGVIHGTTSAYRAMLARRSGQIVNVASMGGLVALPATTAYVATKFAVVGLTMALRTEAEDLGIKVNVVCPSSVRTPIIKTSPVVNVDAARYFALTDGKLKVSEPDRVAQRILRGVERNRAVIFTDGASRFMWWLYRLNPTLLSPLAKAMLRDFRKCRKDSADP